jgi:dihydropyrimidinase
MDTIIRNGTVVTAVDTFKADIGICGGKIAAIADHLEAKKKTEEIDAAGKLVLPGGIDVHVHLELPFCGTVSKDDFANGTKAAACGGVTSLIDYAIQQKGHSIMEAVKARRALADGRVAVDYSLHGGITDWEKAGSEFDDVVEYGITSFKMFMVYRNEGWIADDGTLLAALEATSRNGARIMTHSENDDAIQMLLRRFGPQAKSLGAFAHAVTRPDYTEAEAIARVIRWAEVTGGHLYIVHMSTGKGCDEVKAARARGVDVQAETCPQYLLLTEDLFKEENGHRYATCPQLRSTPNLHRLWKGLQEGTIQVIATDTCTFDSKQKAMWKGDFRKIPYGMPGVETMLPLMFTFGVGEGWFSLNRLVQLCCTNPAKLFGLYPRKGTIAIGTDADLAVWDPKKKVTISPKKLQTNCDWSPFDGYKLTGYPVLTLCRGKVVAKEGKFVGKEGYGRFLKRQRGMEV